MSISPSTRERLEALRAVPAFAEARESSLELLTKSSEEVSIGQGQTLLRIGAIETHAFLLLKGALRLLAEEPHRRELFTVGRLEAGELVGVVDLLRQAPCEAAIARRPCQLLSFPLTLLLDLYLEDPGLKRGLDKLSSPCEAAAVLRHQLKQLNPPPEDGKQWILEQLKHSSSSESSKSVSLLSSLVPGAESLVGLTISQEQKEELESNSTLPLRFWRWASNSAEVFKPSAFGQGVFAVSPTGLASSLTELAQMLAAG